MPLLAPGENGLLDGVTRPAAGRARSGMRQGGLPTASPSPAVAPPSAAPAPTPATSVGGAAAGPAAQPTLTSADVDHVTAAPQSGDRRPLVAGELAIVGAALLVVGLFPGYEWTDSLWTGRTDEPEMRWFVLDETEPVCPARQVW